LALSDRLAQRKIDAKNNGWPWPIDHPNDERALLEGCCPDFTAAERVRRFFKLCCVLPKPGGGVQPFHLLDWWYRDVIAPLFGWKKPDGRRRYDKGFITTAKKSGKSTVLSGLPMYMVLADGEEEAEAYSAATDRDQAAIVYRKTLRAVRLSPSLSKVCRCLESKKQIIHDPSGGIYEAISSDADSAEGKNPHLLIADEVHVWRDRQFFNSLMYGDIVRAQPLFLMITTAGSDETSIGFEEYQFARELIDTNNDFYSQSHFAYIAEAEDKEAWDKPESWLQGQPSLRGEVDELRPRDSDDLPAEPRIIGSLEKLQAKADEAKASPRKKREFIRYICNRWVDVVENPWLNGDRWADCRGPIKDHAGEECWAGLDLAKTQDLAALCVAWRNGDCIDLKWWIWTPEDSVKDHAHAWKCPLQDWINEGWIEATPGADIDYAYIRKRVSGVTLEASGEDLKRRWPNAVAEMYKLREVRCDPYNATELCEEQLEKRDGIVYVPHKQGFISMNGPCKQFEKLVNTGRLRTGGNPVVDWCVRHCIAPDDASDNIKLDKKKSAQKIDPLVAAVMAVGGALAAQPKPSNYKRRGVLLV
jgi:phage terminase large subunit-like protein